MNHTGQVPEVSYGVEEGYGWQNDSQAVTRFLSTVTSTRRTALIPCKALESCDMKLNVVLDVVRHSIWVM